MTDVNWMAKALDGQQQKNTEGNLHPAVDLSWLMLMMIMTYMYQLHITWSTVVTDVISHKD